jgi:hypothetical protein
MMLKSILIVFIVSFGLTQGACAMDEGDPMYEPAPVSAQHILGAERSKRELLQLEDLRIGDGPVAAWGRKISADIEVQYADGTPIYQGPAYAYYGMNGTVTIHNSLRKSSTLSRQQEGIILGLNGMAVGGKRRITVSPGLVCYQGAIGESTNQGANLKVTCGLVGGSRKEDGGMAVRKETLVVDATLTESCIPVFLFIPVIYHGEFRCRASEIPQRDPSAPIWRFYYAEPSRP